MEVSLIKPLDQPSGRLRLLPMLAEGLRDGNFGQLNLIMAYAKSGPLLRLEPDFQQWKTRGGQTYAIFGVDQQGTSRQALEIALTLFDEVSVLRVPNSTFHPKMAWFQGPDLARAFVGSQNLTVGGTETNFEAGVRMDFVLPADRDQLSEFTDAWDQLVGLVSRLDLPLLERLVAEGYVVPERQMLRDAGGGDGSNWRAGLLDDHGFTPHPPSPLPPPIRAGGDRPGGGAGPERVVVHGHDHDHGPRVRAADPAPPQRGDILERAGR